MPYTISRRGDRYCVVKDSDGQTMGCHDSRPAAERQRAALYANEADRAERSQAQREVARLLLGAALEDLPWRADTPNA